MFSSRTTWHRKPNRLASLVAQTRASGQHIHDLTTSNPTQCGITYPEEEILRALSHSGSLIYDPDPKGLLSAREVIVQYYAERGVVVEAGQLVLTASTSEAYSMIFTLLCDPAESVLVPVPSYPLFDFFGHLQHVTLRPYHLRYDGAWHIDLDSIEASIDNSTRAMVIVQPHNPTGMYIKEKEYKAVQSIAARHNLALIVDEVFIDFPLATSAERQPSTAGQSESLTFTLNGISKMAGLPQLKLGWIAVSGPEALRTEALERLEIVSDTFLSVNTPVQVGLSELFNAGKIVRAKILERLRANMRALSLLIDESSPCSVLKSEGGWNAIIRVPQTMTDEEWALKLVEMEGVHVYPGYFFEFAQPGYLVISLLPEEELFEEACHRMIDYIRSSVKDK